MVNCALTPTTHKVDMDLLQIIKLVSIPRWVKFFSLSIVTLFIGLAVYAILGGAHLADGAILQASMGLLGVLLPLAIAIVFLSFYEAGVSPLKNATERVLTELVPDVLSNLSLDTAQFSNKPRIITHFIPAHACRYQIILANGSELQMELQLNVRKICVVFNFRMKHAIEFSELEKRLEHTLTGARHEGYTTNNVITHKERDGLHYNSLVLYKSLPADFLWNSAEKLYFAQDLQVAIQSLIHEVGDDWLSATETNEP